MKLDLLSDYEKEAVSAAAREVRGQGVPGTYYVHLHYNIYGDAWDISTPLSPEELNRGGYLEVYFTLDSLAAL